MVLRAVVPGSAVNFAVKSAQFSSHVQNSHHLHITN